MMRFPAPSFEYVAFYPDCSIGALTTFGHPFMSSVRVVGVHVLCDIMYMVPDIRYQV